MAEVRIQNDNWKEDLHLKETLQSYVKSDLSRSETWILCEETTDNMHGVQEQ